jgi:nucleoside-diphosphate-sugar epimerase/pimeloyl-ACP methyl ester carboxylesterase
VHAAVITGATGFIGSHFLLNFIGNEIPKAHAVVRGRTAEDRADKLRAALVRADESYLIRHDLDEIMARVTIINGDIGRPMLGLEDRDLNEIGDKGPIDFWHFAASLSYEDRRQTEIEVANIEGTKNVLAVARALGAATLYHCSTAYTCGTQEGIITASLPSGHPEFNNHYERTKYLAEKYLSQAVADDISHNHSQRNPKIVVIRPSVVIGNSQTKRPGGASSKLYGLLRQFNKLREALAEGKRSIRIWVPDDTTVNFIPIDEFIRQLRAVSEMTNDAAAFSIRHLVSAGGPTSKQIFDIVRNQLGAFALHASKSEISDKTFLENLVDQWMEFYGSYFRSQRIFVPSVEDAPTLSAAEVSEHIAEALRTLEHRDVGTIFAHTRPTVSDGVVLNAYTSHEHAPTGILLCNAVGMPIEFMMPLAERLSTHAPVLTWESRGLPSSAGNSDDLRTDFQRQVEDAVEILASANVKSALILGWCSGVWLALEIARTWGGDVIGMGLLNGGYNFTNCRLTAFEANMKNMMPHIAADRRYADTLFRSIFSTPQTPDRPVGASQLLAVSASAQDIYMASLPFQSADNIFMYARLLSGFYNREPRINLDLATHTLVLSCSEDIMASPESSQMVADMISNSTFHVVEGGDHFSLYWDRRYIDFVDEFAARSISAHEPGVESAPETSSRLRRRRRLR